jgi:hypothetical protein
MKAKGETEVQLNTILSPARDRYDQLHVPAASPRTGNRDNWIGAWVGPTATLNFWKRKKNPLPLHGIEPRVVQLKAQTYTDYVRILESCFNTWKINGSYFTVATARMEQCTQYCNNVGLVLASPSTTNYTFNYSLLCKFSRNVSL